MTDPIFPPPSTIAARAHVRSIQQYREIYRHSVENPDAFWAEQAKRLTFHRPWHRVRHEDLRSADLRWFEGAELNVCFNCVDRHLPHRADQTAILWAGDEPGAYRHVTYGELHKQVSRIANVLDAHGVKEGDHVCIYMPSIPETTFTMLQCSRIRAIHSVALPAFSVQLRR